VRRQHSTEVRLNSKAAVQSAVSRGAYIPPPSIGKVRLEDLLSEVGREIPADHQPSLLQGDVAQTPALHLYYAGDLSLLKRRAVSVVGTREVSDDGRARARKLARELATAGVLVVSGLAKGVDTAVLTSAIDASGATAAVVGTPLEKCYPTENTSLQEQIYRQHLLLSPFGPGEPVYRSNFPKRNRVMAAITDATVIVEASDSSGTLHQASECQRLGRWLFILRSVVENPGVTWPKRFLSGSNTAIVDQTFEILSKIGSS
jgi:DNA protecting protein DprA